MKIFLISVVFFIGVPPQIHSQKNAALQNQLKIDIWSGIVGLNNRTLQALEWAKESKDNPELMSRDWAPLETEDVNSITFLLDSANYHLTTSTFIFNKNGEVYNINPESVKVVIFDEKRFKLTEYFRNGKVESGFLEVIVEGEMDLLKRHYLEIVTVSDNPMGLRNNLNQKYKRKTEFFVMNKMGKAVKLPRSKSKILDIFRSKRRAVASYAKDNKLSPKKEEDLKKLVIFYNS